MIASISGDISQVLDNQIVINVSGVGFLINVTEEVCRDSRPGMKKAFHTYLVVREDQLSLYGFETLEARDLFVHLISVAGIGPRTALTALSNLTPEAVRRAITGDQPEVFTRVPGIGKKTAQKIILDLQGKIEPLEPLEAVAKMDKIDAEVMDALIALGYSIVEAQAALQSIPRNKDLDAEERLRKALQYYS